MSSLIDKNVIKIKAPSTVRSSVGVGTSLAVVLVRFRVDSLVLSVMGTEIVGFVFNVLGTHCR